MLPLGIQYRELVQRLSDTARPCELQQEEAKATGRSVHFVTLELCELTPDSPAGLPGVGEGLSAPTAAGQKHRMTDGRTQVGRAARRPNDRDRGANTFGYPLRSVDIGRRGLVEGGERPLGGHWGRDLFHDRHPERPPT